MMNAPMKKHHHTTILRRYTYISLTELTQRLNRHAQHFG